MGDFRKSYLPPEAQPWVRELEERVVSLEKQLELSQQNLATANTQLANSYNRLDLAYGNLDALLLNTIDTVNYLKNTQPDLITVAGGFDAWSGPTGGTSEIVTSTSVTIIAPAGGLHYVLMATVTVGIFNYIEPTAGDSAGQFLYLRIGGNGSPYPVFSNNFGNEIYVGSTVDSFNDCESTMITVAEYDLTEGEHQIPILLTREGWDGNSTPYVQGFRGPMRVLLFGSPNDNITTEALPTTSIKRK